MSSAAIRAGRAFVELFADESKLIAGLKSAEAKVRKFGAQVAQIGQGLMKAGTLIVAPLLAAGVAFSKVGDDAAKMARRTGLTTNAVSELAHAAGASGTSIEALEKSLTKMQRTIVDAGDGSQTAVDALAALGLTVENLQGLSPEQQFELLADRLASIEDPTEKAARAMEIFGKSGTQLLPLLEEGADGIRALRQEARDLGLSFDPEDAARAEELNDAIGRLQGTLKKTFLEVGAAIAPILTEWADKFTAIMPGIIAWVQENEELIASLLKIGVVITATGAAIAAAGRVMIGAAAIAGVLTKAFAALRAASLLLVANPVGAFLTGVAIAAVAAAVAVERLSHETAELSQRMAEAREKGDQQRASALTLAERLKQLADKQRLSTEEMQEAETIIARLEGQWGELGMSVNAATGQLEGFTSGFAALLEVLKASALKEVNKEISEAAENIEKAKAEMESAQSWANTEGPWNLFKDMAGVGATADVEAAAKKIEEAHAAWRAAIKRRNALEGGGEGALTGASPSTLEQQSAANAAKHLEDVAKARTEAAAAQERWAQIEEELAAKRRSRFEQEIHEIEQLAAERRKLIDLQIAGEQARAGGPRQEVLDQLEAARGRVDVEQSQAEVAAQDRQTERELDAEDQRQKEAAAKAEEEARAREAVEQAQAAVALETARMEIQLDPNLTDLEKELQLLDLDKQLALIEGIAAGVDPAAIERQFDLRKQLAIQADAAEQEADKATAGSTTGSFSALGALRGLQASSAQDRTAKATEATAKNTAKIAETQKAQELRFG